MRPAFLQALIFALISLVSFAPAGELGSHWLQRSQPVGFQHFESICTNGEVFVTAGHAPSTGWQSFLSVSRDGKSWTVAKQLGRSFLREVAYGNGRFVAVGWLGEIQTSTNGIKWQRATIPTTKNLEGVKWIGSRWVAVGESGTVLTSPDGLTWTQAPGLGTSSHWYSVSVLDTCSLILGYQGILRSTDGGVTWSQVAGAPSRSFTAALQTTSGIMVWSQEGLQLWDGNASWTSPSSPVKSGILYGSVSKIRSHHGFHLMFTNRGEIATSTDGLSWMKLIIPIQDPTGGATADATPTANGWLIVRQDGQVLEATPGATWSATQTDSSGTGSLVAVVRHGGEFLAIGNYQRRFRSADGLTWTSAYGGSSGYIRAVASRGDTLVSVGVGDRISVERPSTTTYVPVSQDSDLFGVAASPSAFVAVGKDGKILRSGDGTAWTPVASGTTELLTSIVWDGSRFRVVGKNGIYLHSADGLTWQKQTTPGQHHLRAIASTSRGLVAVGHRGAILVSQNGSSWADRSLDIPSDLQTIVETDRGLLALGRNLASASSTDGVNWEAGALLDDGRSDISSAVFHNGSLIAVSGMAYDFETGLTVSSESSILISRFPFTLGFLSNPKPRLGAVTTRADGSFIVAGDGVIWSSPDGIRWEKKSMTSRRFQDAETIGEITVLAGASGILWSADGEQWQFGKLSSSGGAVTGGLYSNLTCVCHGDGRWVAAGRSGTLLVSDDGRTWRYPSGYANPPWRDYSQIAHGNGRFVAVGGDKTVRTSADGETWSIPALPSSGDFTDVIWTGQEFRIPAGTSVLVSADGVNWTSRTANLSPGSGAFGKHLTVEDRTYLIGGGERIESTTDQLEWTRNSGYVGGSTTSAVWEREVLDLAKSGDTMVAVGTEGLIMTSTDGFHWTYRNGGMIGDLKSVHWIKDRFFVTGPYGGLFSSPDGGTWTKHQTGIQTKDLTTMAWDGSRAVAMGNGIAFHSTDLWNWTPISLPANTSVTGVVWAGDRFMAVTSNQKAGISPDGVTWTFADAPMYEGYRVAWNGTRAVAGPYRSTDGVTWERINESWASVYPIWDGSKFIYSNDTFVGISPDGLSGYRVLDGPLYLREAIHTDHGYFALVYDVPSYRVYRSADAIHWTDSGQSLPGSIRGFAWSGRQLMAAGQGGEIYTTSPVDSPLLLASVSNQGESTENDLSLEGDANLDGIGNAVAHYFGLPLSSPSSLADRARLPHLAASESGERLLEFSLPESDAPLFLDLIIERSGDLNQWNEFAVRAPSGTWSEPAVSEASSNGFRKVSLPLEPTEDPGFWRLKVRERP